MWYSDIKIFLENYSGLERDALHIHFALFLYIVAMAVFRQTRKSRIPWLFVLGVEIANEILDVRTQYLVGTDIRWWEAVPAAWESSARDIWNTMLWPTVLLVVGRYTDLFQHRSEATGKGS